MRVAAILSIVIMLSAFQCRRHCGPGEGPFTLQGKWKFTEYYVSPGDASVNWQQPPPGQTFIEFRNDGTFATDLSMFYDHRRYEIKNDSSLIFIGGSNNLPITISFRIEGSRLSLRPPCFEGCAYRFKRQ